VLREHLGLADAALSAQSMIPGAQFDAVPRNLIITADGSPRFIDQEWQLSTPIELGFLVFRGVLLGMLSVSSVANPAPGTPTGVVDLFLQVAQPLGLRSTREDLPRYVAFEHSIQQWACAADGVRLDELEACHLTVRRGLVVQNEATRAMPEPTPPGQQAVSQRDDMEDELVFLRQALVEANMTLQAMRKSTSWRIAAPLRHLKAVLIKRMPRRTNRKR